MDADFNITLNIRGIQFKCVVCGNWWVLPDETLRQFKREGSEPIPYCGKCKPPDVGFKLMKDTIVEDYASPKDVESMTIEELQVR